VILINLLPHREEKRRRRKQAFFAGLGMSAVVGVAAVGVWYVVLQQLTEAQQARNEFLAAEITKLNNQIKDIANLRAEIEALKARQKAVEDLQTDRNVPVHLLNELAQRTPEGAYLTTIKQTGDVVAIAGQAQTNERVSEMLRNALYSAQWIERPELVEIKAAPQPGGSRAAATDQRRLFDFSMRVMLKRPQAADAAGATTAAAAPAKP
jgi:type IV pilus assembly protein PilN